MRMMNHNCTIQWVARCQFSVGLCSVPWSPPETPDRQIPAALARLQHSSARCRIGSQDGHQNPADGHDPSCRVRPCCHAVVDPRDVNRLPRQRLHVMNMLQSQQAWQHHVTCLTSDKTDRCLQKMQIVYAGGLP